MNKKKKIIMSAIIIVALIIIIAAGYTFSRYFQSVTGDATATIASWAFKANAGEENKKLGDIVLKPTSGNKIAPGTSGEFQIKVDATGSDVDVDYVVNISQEKLPANMKFKLKNASNDYETMAALAEAEMNDTLTSSVPTKTYNIVWNWPIGSEATNNNDMEALKLSNLGFHIEVLGEQAN